MELISDCFVSLGTITNPGPRRSIPVLVYVRATLYVPELIWAILGAIWVSDDSRGCEPAEVGAVIAAVVARWVGRMFFPVLILWYDFGDFHDILSIEGTFFDSIMFHLYVLQRKVGVI